MPWVRIAVAALVLAFCAGCYVKGRSDGRKLERADAQADIDAWMANADAAAELYAEALDRKQIEYRTITKTIEVAKNATPDIPDCRTGDDWMRIYRQNAAIANSRQPAATVPASNGNADRADAR